MKKIIIASKNPVKINAALEGFKRIFPKETFEAEGISVSSGVSDQPKTNSETFNGALNRVNNAKEAFPEADFWIGMEGGVEDKEDNEMESFAWVIIKSSSGKTGKSKTATFYLPQQIAELVKQGKELGDADDIIFNQSNSKQKNGTVGILTGDAVDRTKYYITAVILALIPFKNNDLYSK